MTTRRTSFIAAAIVAAVFTAYIAAGSLIVHAVDAVLVLLVAILYGVLLRNTGKLLSRLAPVPVAVGVGISAAVQVLLAIAVLWFTASQIASQIDEAVSRVDEAKAAIRTQLDRYPQFKTFVMSETVLSDFLSQSDTSERSSQQSSSDGFGQGSDQSRTDGDDGQSSTDRSAASATTERSAGGPPEGSLVSGASSVLSSFFTTTFGAIANLLIIFFVGLYLALDPETYRRGFLKLLPARNRQRAHEILCQTGDTLWHWIVGRIATMAITGVGIGVTLWAIGVPLPITLGLVTGLLTFVPNIGPIIALAVAVLVALPEGMQTVGLTIAGFIGFQLLESYVITPLIQKKQIDLPPAVILVAQLLLGVVAGFLGVATATPIVAIAIVVIGMLYVENHLGESRELQPMPGLDGPSDALSDDEELDRYRRWQESQRRSEADVPESTHA